MIAYGGELHTGVEVSDLTFPTDCVLVTSEDEEQRRRRYLADVDINDAGVAVSRNPISGTEMFVAGVHIGGNGVKARTL